MNNGFPKQARLRAQEDFDAVYQSKHFAADACLVVHATRNGTEKTRLGLSVSRKVGNAVVRNHWKRRIRESFRLQQSDLPAGLDIVVRPRKGAEYNFDAISQSLKKLCLRLDKKIPRDSQG
jgi:ribonuclease P protein component